MKGAIGILCVLALVHGMPFDLKSPPSELDAAYDDSFARNKILPICAATDNDDPSICLNNNFQNAELIRRVRVTCSPYRLDKCVGYTAALHADKAIVLAFKGTQGFAQLALESEETVFSNHTAWIAGGTVSKYFNDAFFNVWNNGMKDDFLKLKNQYPDYSLWVAGHSLGGAMASLGASFVVHTGLFPGERTRLVTFGQPRTGNRDYASSVDSEIDYVFRIIHAKDVVPHLPPNGLEKYHHHHTEIYYNNDMSTADYKVCRGDEDYLCSDGQIDTSTADHSMYFKDVGAWGAAGCPN